MNTNNTHDTKCESTPETPPNIKFLMEPTSILANLTAKLGCRLGELGTPDSIHRTGQTLWLHQLGSTEPSFLLEAQGSPCLPRSLARSSQCGSGNRALLLVTFSTPGCRVSYIHIQSWRNTQIFFSFGQLTSTFNEQYKYYFACLLCVC